MSDVEDIIFEGRMPHGDPVGCCIYCGSDGRPGGLSDEHTVPFSLGADAYLPDASCTACATETSKIELYAGRTIYGPLRVAYRVQSRRKKIELRHVPVKFQTERGLETRMLPRAELPTFLMLPILERPGFFTNRPPKAIEQFYPWFWYAADYKEKMEKFRQPGDKSFHMPMSCDAQLFARFLAKIAHTFAVAQLGIDSFLPFLPEFILGKRPRFADFLVGAHSPPTEPQQLPQGTHTATAHDLSLSMLTAGSVPEVIQATIKLFQFTGSPTYAVMVGRPLAGAIAKLSPVVHSSPP